MKQNYVGEPVQYMPEPSRANNIQKPCKAGQNIHILSRQGIYQVIGVSNLWIIITCKKWILERNQGQRTSAQDSIPLSDFKCLAGGHWNL